MKDIKEIQKAVHLLETLPNLVAGRGIMSASFAFSADSISEGESAAHLFAAGFIGAKVEHSTTSEADLFVVATEDFYFTVVVLS